MVAKKRKKVKWKININKKKITETFWLSFLFFIIIFLTFSCFNIYEKKRTSEKNLDILNKQIEELKKEKDLLSFTLGETYSDEYLERVAREDLGMQKPGEKIFIIKKEVEEIEEKIIKETSFYDRAMNWFKNAFNLPE
jgi:cell division protein FtsB